MLGRTPPGARTVIGVSGRTGARASRLGAVLFAGLMAAVLAGCGSGGYTAAGPFRPLPEGAPPEVGPPTPGAPAPAPAPGPGTPARPGSGTDAGDPNVVASGLAVPTGLVVLPDGSAIVGERDTGRLLQVFPDRSPARVRMTVPGIDAAGDGGLLGLALSPTYDQDGLLYAYLSTATDNRVVRFPLGASRTRCSPASRTEPCTTAGVCCSAPTASSSSAPATPATRR